MSLTIPQHSCRRNVSYWWYMKEQIQETVAEVLRSIGVDTPFVVEHPTHSDYGDYTTNAALIASRTIAMSPMDIAERIRESTAELPFVEMLLLLIRVL